MCAVLLTVCAGTALASGPDYFHYQVFFPSSPTDGNDALATFDQRASAMIRAGACGEELAFGLLAGKGGEGITAIITAKLEWLADRHDQHPNALPPTLCQFSRRFLPYELCPYAVSTGCDTPAVVSAFAKSAFYKDLQNGRIASLNDNLKLRFSPFCRFDPLAMHRDGMIASSGRIAPNDSSDIVRIDFAVDRGCMLGQINAALMSMKVEGQMGTDGAPCHGKGLLGGKGTKGDWDMTVRNLTRIVYLDERYGMTLLNPVVRAHVHQQLLTADGSPAEESYPLWGCGNTQESTGTSQDRADERSWVDDVGSWLKDNFLDFFKILLIIFVFLTVAAAVAAAVGGAAGFWAGVVAGAAAAGAVGIIASADVPETENHLLMINTSKYLKNQKIIEELGWSSESAKRYRADQLALRSWLLNRMQGFLKRDFVEYNSRPYQRLSIVSILNIADFANDDHLRTGAQMVLDYTTAKFDVGSQQGRRMIPFRRLRSTIKQDVLVDSFRTNGLFDLVSGGDVQTAMGLLFAGQTQQLNGAFISFGAAESAIYFATSRYRPEAFVTDLAIRKDSAVFQRMHYASSEIYSSERSFLISAGGVTSGQAYSGTGIEALDQLVAETVKNDLGAALPTTLFLAGSPQIDAIPTDRTTLYDLIRIEGRRADGGEYPSFDHNLCVWSGFACGTNVVIPSEFAKAPAFGKPPCMVEVPSGADARWNFIDTSLCTGYERSPRSFIAIYRHDCPMAGTDCDDNFGFFEVIDASAPGQANNAFDLFRKRVVAANPPGFVAPFLVGFEWHRMGGTYRSQRGQRIRFSADAHQKNEYATGIMAINDIPQYATSAWGFADGDASLNTGIATPIASIGDGLVTVKGTGIKGRLELDFRDVNNPVRTVH